MDRSEREWTGARENGQGRARMGRMPEPRVAANANPHAATALHLTTGQTFGPWWNDLTKWSKRFDRRSSCLTTGQPEAAV